MFDELSIQSKVLVVAACSMVTITVRITYWFLKAYSWHLL